MARKTHTEAQARYDKVNRRVYGFRLHNEIDSDIIAKLASVDSMQGYIKQLIREDITRTKLNKSSNGSVPNTETESKLTSTCFKSVPVSTKPVPKYRYLIDCHVVKEFEFMSYNFTEEQIKAMKQGERLKIGRKQFSIHTLPVPRTYHIKPEYYDLWVSSDDTRNPEDIVITDDDIIRLAHDWEVTKVSELKDQLIPD